MVSWLSAFQRKGIRFKLLIYFLSLILLPFLTIGLLSDFIYTGSIERETNLHAQEIIEQIQKNVEFYMSDMDHITHYISEDPSIHQFFQIRTTLDSNRVSTETDVRRLLRTYTDVHPEIAGILVVNKNDLYISNEQYRISRDPLTQEEWYKRAVSHDGNLLLISRPIGRNISSGHDVSADEVLSVLKAIKDTKTNELLGVIAIDFKLDTIEKMIQKITLGKTGFIAIMDEAGEIVYSPDNPVVYRINAKWLEDSLNTQMVQRINNNLYQIMYTKSDFTKWKVIGVFSVNEIFKEATSIRIYTLLIACVTMIIAVIVAIFYTSSIASPMNKLKNIMKKVESGDLNVHFDHTYYDEIGQVGNGFNNMLKEIRNLIELVYKEQQGKREAEIKILQAQIKPHFLYNTLDAIQWMAHERGAKDLVEMIDALTNFFRIGLSKGKETLSVRDEIEHVRSYLIIQKIRYEDKLEFEIDCDEGLDQYLVLKLTLQPLVENAIYHGIKARRGVGKVTVRAKKINDMLVFSVADNGIGLLSEKLQELSGMLGNTEKGSNELKGFGLYNVNERIKLNYGSGYGLAIQSEYQIGTIVEVRHPLLEK
ncbi:sensor histidine kinase [Paenibacillus sp. N3.4]|uniref:sensor histidine kinase n=1 Tax=Paenibacillus sp. N3.4 TaxID=2603222 RepID=UPI0011C88CC1|nr:sensor histidine kinase [Paenibacillus sp. N3.4]TXK84921.1 HAMP domain-containing protein [Paenibacillus sp. N3.4]